MKVLFGMALRQATGFVESLLRLIGLDWAVPDFSTLSRRQKTLKVNIPYRGSDGPLHLLVDIEPVSATGSSEPARGIKVEGEGEWNARKHGGTKRPSPRFLEPVAKPWLDWRKIHIGIDEMEEDQEPVQWTVSPTTPGNPGRRVHHQRRGRRADAARTARPDPARSGDRHRHRRRRLRYPQVPPLRGFTRPHQGPRSPFAPSRPAGQLRSFRPARMPNHGSPTRQEP